MCTLLVATRIWPGTPLLVAANRDERLDRPSAAPRALECGPRRAFAPLDLLAGGTWLGVNDRGLLAAITNRFHLGGSPSSDGKLSRGLLVQQALGLESAAAAARQIANIKAETYNGFHLLMADTHGAWVVWSDGEKVSSDRLQPGLHVITERSLGAAPSQRENELQRVAKQLAAAASPPVQDLEDCLKMHRHPPTESCCVHLPELNYGTRSSTTIRFDDSGPRSFRYAAGPPCSSPFQDLSQAMTDGLRSGDHKVAT